jgi:hypothetical protein
MSAKEVVSCCRLRQAPYRFQWRIGSGRWHVDLQPTVSTKAAMHAVTEIEHQGSKMYVIKRLRRSILV